MGFNVFIFDYRWYGKSNGKITKETDLYIDANSALEYLIKEKNINIKDIIIWGRSLGWAIAIDTAQNKNIFAVIIESSFFSMDYMANKQFWFLPIKILSKFHFRSDRKIKNINSKILIIHSNDDKTIPLVNGKNLFKEAKNPKTFLKISGSHNYGFQQSYDLYIKTIKKFLEINKK